MPGLASRLPAAVALLACLLGLVFAYNSTADYASHLDRQLHDMHCSFIPGSGTTSEAEACRAAMYSPYSALLKEEYWGGIPISLFALGAFTFFAGFACYLLILGGRASRGALAFFATVSSSPLLVSAGMFVISVTQLGTICKTCAGIYTASLLLAIGGVWTYLAGRRHSDQDGGGALLPLVWLACLAVVTLIPAVAYAASMPDHTKHLADCGTLAQPIEKHDALVKMRTQLSRQPATLFEDPLCPTCKAFHERLVAEGIFDKLDVQLALFPLDNSCNWMLDRPLHPGACTVSKAVLCAGPEARRVMEWAYEEQAYLLRAGKAGEPTLREVIRQRWGHDMLACIDKNETTVRLNNHLHFAAENSVPVSTPQVYLGKRRICDEDTDIGLRFTLKKLAPELL